jgi:hypothetical protein
MVFALKRIAQSIPMSAVSWFYFFANYKLLDFLHKFNNFGSFPFFTSGEGLGLFIK